MVAIGDVVGHDLHAAAAMGQLRTMLRVLAFQPGRSVSQLLDQVDRTLAGLGSTRLATAVLARLDPDGPAHRFSWSNAGHPPPLLRHASGRVEILETEPDLLLGLGPGSDRRTHSAPLPAGSTVLLYTDGLIERRDRSLDEGVADLARLLTALGDRPLEELADGLLAQALPAACEDDVALLVFRTPSRDAGPGPVVKAVAMNDRGNA
jgi:serine phosphatase RsbU (regulator of sigma subunit)